MVAIATTLAMLTKDLVLSVTVRGVPKRWVAGD
jgi:hypothetical protein